MWFLMVKLRDAAVAAAEAPPLAPRRDTSAAGTNAIRDLLTNIAHFTVSGRCRRPPDARLDPVARLHFSPAGIDNPCRSLYFKLASLYRIKTLINGFLRLASFFRLKCIAFAPGFTAIYFFFWRGCIFYLLYVLPIVARVARQGTDTLYRCLPFYALSVHDKFESVSL